MILNGREVNFAYTMRAAKALAEICPNRDMSLMGDALQGKFGNIVDNQTAFIIAMNQAYNKSSDHKDEEIKPITADELLDLSQDEFQEVFLDAAAAMDKDSKIHVETKPVKKAGTQPKKQP